MHRLTLVKMQQGTMLARAVSALGLGRVDQALHVHAALVTPALLAVRQKGST